MQLQLALIKSFTGVIVNHSAQLPLMFEKLCLIYSIKMASSCDGKLVSPERAHVFNIFLNFFHQYYRV